MTKISFYERICGIEGRLKIVYFFDTPSPCITRLSKRIKTETNLAFFISWYFPQASFPGKSTRKYRQCGALKIHKHQANVPVPDRPIVSLFYHLSMVVEHYVHSNHYVNHSVAVILTMNCYGCSFNCPRMIICGD